MIDYKAFLADISAALSQASDDYLHIGDDGPVAHDLKATSEQLDELSARAVQPSTADIELLSLAHNYLNQTGYQIGLTTRLELELADLQGKA